MAIADTYSVFYDGAFSNVKYCGSPPWLTTASTPTAMTLVAYTAVEEQVDVIATSAGILAVLDGN